MMMIELNIYSNIIAKLKIQPKMDLIKVETMMKPELHESWPTLS